MTEPSQSSRREFLQGRSAAQALGAAVDATRGSIDPPMPRTAQPYLLQFKRRAMACDFQLFVNAGQNDAATEVALSAFDLIDELERQLTVYRDTSEVAVLNRTAESQACHLELGLFRLLERALALHAETGGAFDVTAGPLTKVWGFFRRAGAIPDAQSLNAALACVGSQNLVLDRAAQTVQFLREGVELNFGSIGKGYALDRCDELMRAAGVSDFLWHGGQSSVLARGRSGDAPERGWLVGVRNPVTPDRRIGELWLRDRALATSGASVQFFRHQGRRYGHILDPRTGWPAEGVLSVTVLAPTAAEADALSTAFYVMGVEQALGYCQRRPEIGAIVLYPSSTGSRVEIATAGLAAKDWQTLGEQTL